MKAIGSLLHRAGGSDAASFSAAQVVGAVNDVLVKTLSLEPRDAQTISWQRGIITIAVSHGAVAGKIQQRAEEIKNATNLRLGNSAVNKIITRQQPPR